MAEHRKSFRPRRLGFGGRHLPRGRLVAAALALVVVWGSAPSTVLSQQIGLTRGEASLSAGQYEIAVQQLSATVNDSESTVDQAAKALYLRGIAYRKLGMPGRAVSDLGAALWLGLGSSDKVRALTNKGLAFRAAGLSGQAEAALEQARRSSSAGEVERIISQDGGAQAVSSTSVASDVASGESLWDRVVPSMPTMPSFGSSSSSDAPAPAQEPAETEPAAEGEAKRTAEAAPSTGWTAQVADETAEPSGNAVSRWFGSLAGDSAPAPPPEPAATSPEPARPTVSSSAPSRTTTATRTATAPPPSAESWAANTETEREGEGGTAIGRWFNRQTSSEPAPAPAASPAPRGGGYTVQLANSQSKAEAEALWNKARSASSQAASAGSRIEKVEIGSFGTFYSVKIGPFASESESAKVCNALKRGGTDCSVVSPDGP